MLHVGYKVNFEPWKLAFLIVPWAQLDETIVSKKHFQDK